VREHPNTIKAALFYVDDYRKKRADRVRKALDALEAAPEATGSPPQELERALHAAVSAALVADSCR